MESYQNDIECLYNQFMNYGYILILLKLENPVLFHLKYFPYVLREELLWYLPLDFETMANKLSFRDNAILNCVFNPNLPLDQAYEEELTEELRDNEDLPDDVLEEIKKRELAAIQRAENKDFDGALVILNEEILKTPFKPSLYNNRAQVYQFLGKLQDAVKDLSLAIELAGDKQKRTLCQAYCQRGLVYRKMDKFEDARLDFSKAAELGSKFARSQLVEINPYAALCNQMLMKVMDELK